MIYVGIDNGLRGGIVALNDRREIVSMSVMPIIKGGRTEYDIPAIINIFNIIKKGYDEDIVVGLEKAQVTHIAGKNSCFGMGYCYGLFNGILSAMNIPYQVFRAQEWQKHVLSGINGSDTKQRSIIYCKRKYPNVDFRATERSVNEWDGITDALCIAEYTRFKND